MSSLSAIPNLDDLTRASFFLQFGLSPDPGAWGLTTAPEPDDALHEPDPQRDSKRDRGGSIFSIRGLVNVGCLFLIVLGILGVLCVFASFDFFMRVRAGLMDDF